MSFTYKSPSRLEWKEVKKKHAAVLKAANINFDEKLGPFIDKADELYGQLKKLSDERVTLFRKMEQAGKGGMKIAEAMLNQIEKYNEQIRPLAGGTEAQKAAYNAVSPILSRMSEWVGFAGGALENAADLQAPIKEVAATNTTAELKAALKTHAVALHDVNLAEIIPVCEHVQLLAVECCKLSVQAAAWKMKVSVAAKTTEAAVEVLKKNLLSYENKILPLKTRADEASKHAYTDLHLALQKLGRYETDLELAAVASVG